MARESIDSSTYLSSLSTAYSLKIVNYVLNKYPAHF